MSPHSATPSGTQEPSSADFPEHNTIRVSRDGIHERQFWSRFLDINLSLLRLEFLSCFCPRFSVSQFFFIRIFKTKKSMVFCKNPLAEETVNSMKLKTRIFCQFHVQKFHLSSLKENQCSGSEGSVIFFAYRIRNRTDPGSGPHPSTGKN